MGMLLLFEGPPRERLHPHRYVFNFVFVLPVVAVATPTFSPADDRTSGCVVQQADLRLDRELTLVPKKGRPVTQCQHCRLERKKRSAHVKCDCAEGEKQHHTKEKCIHLREAEERAKAGFRDDQSTKPATEDPHHLAAVAEEQGCCCGHGGKCSCSLIKKEPHTKDGSPPHGPAVHKPRLETTRSDGSLTVFANGHHKPVHKRNHAAHECGMPYKMPMPRNNSEQNTATQARRSVDSLALDSNMSWNSSAAAIGRGIPSGTGGERRMSKSEQPSPRPNACPGSFNGGLTDAKLSSIDFSTLGPVQTNQSVDSIVSEPSSMFPPFDPMSGMADASYDPWSAYPSADSNGMPNNNPFSVWATAFDNSNVAQPALTAASSGTQSEIDEIPSVDDMYGFSMPSIQEDGAFNMDSSSGDNSNSNRRSLPPNFFGNMDFTVPNMTADEFQVPVGTFGSEIDKDKSMSNDQSFAMSEVWNTPTMPTMTSIAQRSTPAASNLGRPTSHSVGPGNAPSEDIIKQLFPDFDINNGLFASGNSPTAMDNSANKRMSSLPVNSSSVGMDLGPMDESIGFTSQPWSDGSLSMPNDAFANPFNLDSTLR